MSLNDPYSEYNKYFSNTPSGNKTPANTASNDPYSEYNQYFFGNSGQQPATPQPAPPQQVQKTTSPAPATPQPEWRKLLQGAGNALGSVFNIPGTKSLIPDNSTLNQPFQKWAGKLPQAAGVGIVKGAEDIARTAATSVPTSEFLAWQHRWQKVHPNGALPPLTSPMGQALLKKDIAAGLIDPPPSDITLGNTVENAYNKNIDQPLKKKLGITGTPGENLAGGLGEFVVPSLIGDPMLKGLGLAGDATGLSGAEKIAARVAGSVPRALQQW